ncbi:branched-chain amino acid ABC transporter permease [Methylocella silvestris]|uniref:Branched-chain amino acid ABC transporter permease n=1 Tax=Methylocella silvestris TaxID=199596 RepID=A0A2J7TMG7_METSI|nr:branched-chain amino acid ABC transporter permease [Methylocella silvestris]PNG27968.1 branched-chain amino acid ABC transporter permease [Methylocella silvestris]
MLLQQIINGIVAGSAYALFALGFTLTFGVLKIVNLTYGFYFSAGAYLALFATLHGAPITLALPFAAIAAGFIAVFLDSALLSRLRRQQAPELASLMVTLGATLFLYTGMTALIGSEIQRFPLGLIESAPFRFNGASISLTQIAIVMTAGLLAAGLIGVLRATRTGLAMRAMAENPQAGELMGIDTGAIMRRVSFLCGAIAGASGVLIGLEHNAITPYMGETMALKGFAVIILGGLGDVGGALIAGLLIGLLEALTAGYISSIYKDAVGFLLLVLTLWARPFGLFGRASVRRA